MAQDLITSLDPYNGVCEKYENGKRRMYVILSPEEVAAGKTTCWTELDIQNKGIKNFSPHLWELRHLTALYLNNNKISRLPPEICQLQNLVHLDLSNNKLRSLPVELGDMLKLHDLLLTNNSIRLLPYELGRLFQLTKLELEGNPLTPELLQKSREVNGTQKLLQFLLDTLEAPASPPDRPWLTVREKTGKHMSFKVMCYNILSDSLAKGTKYGYCPSSALAWDHRKHLIMSQITESGADIIALQEVETDKYYNFFLPALKNQGYEGCFCPKSRSKTLPEEERKHVDGCAIFFNRNKFGLHKEKFIDYSQLAIANAEGADDMINRVQTKDNIGIVCCLDIKEPSHGTRHNKLVILNTHINWDPEYSDVKLIQNIMFMNEVETFVKEIKGCYSIPMVVAGDFNSTPDSAVIEFLLKSQISTEHREFHGLKYHGFLKKANGESLGNKNGCKHFKHGFKLKSCYSDDLLDKLRYTNYTYDFKGILDHIFHSKDSLRTVGVLGGIDVDWLKENKIIGCPNVHYPSDHFPLISELELINPNSR
ncbi:hypothetical protein ACHWQZ_G006933 [Mnemiopsis leidyi]